jgi:uncharacterized membrane protein HdeD (DUF308 family)
MFKTAFLLIGPMAFRPKSWLLAAIGFSIMALSLAMAAFPESLLATVISLILGAAFIANGSAILYSASTSNLSLRDGLPSFAQAVVLLILGGLLIGLIPDADRALTVMFCLALVFDGCSRMGFPSIVRYRGWRVMVAIGLSENLFALLILAKWPFESATSVALCLAIFFGLSGAWLVRFAFSLKRHRDEFAILSLPVFCGRGWYDHAQALPDQPAGRKPDQPLTVRVWTPVGSAERPERWFVIDRYIATVGGDGLISTGHSAMQMGSDLYISHYPETEILRSRRDFFAILRGTAENDCRGIFHQSYAEDVADWCDADGHVEIRNYDPARLRAFWDGYCRDDTYNVTSRNCSILVATALDAALEGALDTDRPWRRLASLLINPDLWMAALLRSRAAPMTWTPGLTLDYANAMARIVDAPGWTKSAPEWSWPRLSRSDDRKQTEIPAA